MVKKKDKYYSKKGKSGLHSVELQGVPKKVSVKPIFEFQTSGWVFLGVKNNSKNFGNKKNSRLLSKIWSKWALFV